MKQTLFLLFIVASMISCSSKQPTTKPVTEISPMDMVAKWRVESLPGRATLSTNPTMYLDLKENKITGKGGCNNYNGPVTRDGFKIQFKGIVSTKMMCPDASVEDDYFNALDRVESFGIKGNILTFYDGSRKALITYSKVSR